jgi:hypothetical protein
MWKKSAGGQLERAPLDENMYGDVLEPLLAFFVAAWPFAEVTRLTVVSKTCRRVNSFRGGSKPPYAAV